MAKPGAMVHMVGAETGAHQLLEQPGFFVGALGTAETGERIRSVLCFKLGQSPCRQIQRFFPTCLPEVRQRIGRIKVRVEALGNALPADQRPSKPRRVRGIIEAKTAFHAEPALI